MSEFRTRDELRSRVIGAFKKEPEVHAIFLFGREVDEQTDQYSDLDVVVCSNDLARTQSRYLQLLNDISPIIGTLLLESSEENLSQMLMLQDFSPYQKIDLSITDCIETKISAGFGPFTSVYSEDQQSDKVHSRLDVFQEHSIVHHLRDYLFSVPRFTKCLFRQDRDMYRRWEGIKNGTLGLLYEKYVGWEEQGSRSKLSAKEHFELDRVLSQDDRALLNEILPPSGQINIAASFVKCMQVLIALCKQKADHFEIEVDLGFARYIEHFLHSEIERWSEK